MLWNVIVDICCQPAGLYFQLSAILCVFLMDHIIQNSGGISTKIAKWESMKLDQRRKDLHVCWNNCFRITKACHRRLPLHPRHQEQVQ